MKKYAYQGIVYDNSQRSENALDRQAVARWVDSPALVSGVLSLDGIFLGSQAACSIVAKVQRAIQHLYGGDLAQCIIVVLPLGDLAVMQLFRITLLLL